MDNNGIDWEEVGDLMRPYEPGMDDEDILAPVPIAEPAQADSGKAHWKEKVDEEDRQHRVWEAMFRRLRRNKGEKKERKHFTPPLWLMQMAHVAPYAILLLLTPWINNAGLLYLFVLLTVLPITLFALPLRPLGRYSWLLQLAAPLLPVQAYFAWQYFLWNPSPILFLLGGCALAGSIYYIAALRDKTPPAEPSHPALNLEVQPRKKKRKDRAPETVKAAQAQRRRLLLFVSLLACISLLVPSLLGVGMQLYTPPANPQTETELLSLDDAAYMAWRMQNVYRRLEKDTWPTLSRKEKEQALQALLDVETDELGIPRYHLRSRAVQSITQKSGEASLPSALFSGKAKHEQRVRTVCHLAFHLKQLSIADTVDMAAFEAGAQAWEDNRVRKYIAVWEDINLAE